MLGKRLHIAICISAALHCTFLAALLYVAYHRPSDELGGSGTREEIAISVLSEDIIIASPVIETKGSPLPTIKKSKMTAPAIPRPSKRDRQTSKEIATRTTGSRDDTLTGFGPGKEAGPKTGDQKKQLSRIWAKINRSKYYPLQARRNLWEGKPRVTFKIGNDGQVEYVKLTKSCGIAMLDEAAVETVKRAVPLPKYPKPITVTIRYSLNE